MNAFPSRSDARLESDPQDPHGDFRRLRGHLEACVLGQPELVERLLVCLISDGHLLVEGAPGLAKTTAVKVLAEAIDRCMEGIAALADRDREASQHPAQPSLDASSESDHRIHA